MPRRYSRWKDAVGTAVAGLWPVLVTLGTLRNPARYNPVAVFSGLGSIPFHALNSLPTTDPNIYATSYTLGLRSAILLAHGHIPWWNPFEGLGAPLIGELQSGGLFPFTMLLLFHDGSLVFHLSLEVVAGVATYWLLREFRCSPLVAAIGGMLFATNGTFAWLGNAAFNPVCFLPLMLLGVERSRRAAKEGKGGGWRWLAVGTAFALLAGFIETAALGLILIFFVGIQRGFTLEKDRIVPYVRKAVAGIATGVAIAAPVLVAFRSYLLNGFVAEHAGNAALGKLGSTYVAMSVSPYMFGRLFESGFPPIHNLWGAVGGYAGFALLALAAASLFGRRERGLRLVLAAWVFVCLADSTGILGIRQVVSSMPVLDHIVLYRYLAPTWELALVVLAAFALRDLATSSRAESLIAVTSGVMVSSVVLLIGLHVAPRSVQVSRALTPSAFKQSVLLVVVVSAGMLLATLVPSRFRGALVGLVVVAEAALLFAVPLLSWPQHIAVDTRAQAFLQTHVGDSRFFGIGPPSANFGTQIGVRQLNVVDLPVPKALVPIIATLDPYENPTIFTGVHHPFPGAPGPAQLLFRNLNLYEKLGVRYIVAPARLHLFAGRGLATLAYHDAMLNIWELPHYRALVRVPGCGLAIHGQDQYVVSCPHRSVLLRNELYFPGWTASVNGVATTVQDRGRFQAVALPKGRSVVTLTFLPPGVPLAAVVAAIGLVGLLVPWELVATWRRRRRAQGQTGLAVLGASLPDRPAKSASLEDPAVVEPPTGAVAATPSEAPDDAEVDAPTSAVPAVAGAVRSDAGPADPDGPPTSVVTAAVPAEVGTTAALDGPPTLSVTTDTGSVPVADPPTLAVRVERSEPTGDPTAEQP